MAEFTNLIVIDDPMDENIEYACGSCGDFLVSKNDTDCEGCGSFIHPDMKTETMTFSELLDKVGR